MLDGKYAWFYAPGDAQVQQLPASQLDDLRSPLRFLLGHTQLEKELSGLTMTPKDGGYLLRGVPRGMEKRVAPRSRLSVTAGGRDPLDDDRRDGRRRAPASTFRTKSPMSWSTPYSFTLFRLPRVFRW